MSGALNSLLRQGPPPTPPGGPQQGSSVPDAPQGAPPGAAPGGGGNPLAALLQGGGAQGGVPGQGGPPAPSHAQTVAALTHLQAVQKSMDGLSRLPGIGKENIRPAIFDSIAELLSQRLFTLPQVMTEIKSIPSDPPGQRNWVLTHLRQISEAQKQLLMDHAQGSPGTGDLASELANSQMDPSQSHTDMMGSVADHYSGRRR